MSNDGPTKRTIDLNKDKEDDILIIDDDIFINVRFIKIVIWSLGASIAGALGLYALV